MSAVDVLAIMDDSNRVCGTGEEGCFTLGEMIEARAAVAELIEAAKEAKPILGACGIYTRLSDALARCGGAP